MKQWLSKLAKKFRNRNMCKCANPYFEVKDALLKCRNCGRPVSRDNWNQDHMRALKTRGN